MKVDYKYYLLLKEYNDNIKKELAKFRKLYKALAKIEQEGQDENYKASLNKFMDDLQTLIDRQKIILKVGQECNRPGASQDVIFYQGNEDVIKLILEEMDKVKIKVYPKHYDISGEYKLYFFLT